MFGPYATEILADLGAEVIKIEAPSGDMFRRSGAAEKLLELFAGDRLSNDVRFSTKDLRQKNSMDLYAEIALRTPVRSASEWTELFEASGIPSMPMHDLEDVLEARISTT